MRASKKLLRLELYIDTPEEVRNLEIIDRIKAKIKVPAALKDRIEYERKEGRRAQRVCVSFPDFELSDRSCWAAYMQDILSVADDFFDTLEARCGTSLNITRKHEKVVMEDYTCEYHIVCNW